MKKGLIDLFLFLAAQSGRLSKPAPGRFVVVHHQQIMLGEFKRGTGITAIDAVVEL